MSLVKFLLPKCPRCNHILFKKAFGDGEKFECIYCGAKLEIDQKRLYFARFIFLFIFFVLGVVFVKTWVSLTINILIAFLSYLLIIKYDVHTNSGSKKRRKEKKRGQI